MVRIVSGDKQTTHAALPPSDAEERQPCAKLKHNQPSAIQRNDWNLKTLKLAKPMSQKEQRYRPIRDCT
ncbi:hypothetical protein GCM10010919_14480 [Alishewanella longhuensis]|uniref:Uncharacterized protein n=1 Tax=Alishewanella longhuensis TaxID=1091037 RepID=A0ABQ3KY23_9ALTE|nr:hypothetical protein GCM10010919_14480 [Alishewanella longhuensis]